MTAAKTSSRDPAHQRTTCRCSASHATARRGRMGAAGATRSSMTLPRKERKGTADANDGCSTATRLEVARPVQRTVRDLQLDGKVIVTSHEQIARLGLFAESDC